MEGGGKQCYSMAVQPLEDTVGSDEQTGKSLLHG